MTTIATPVAKPPYCSPLVVTNALAEQKHGSYCWTKQIAVRKRCNRVGAALVAEGWGKRERGKGRKQVK